MRGSGLNRRWRSNKGAEGELARRGLGLVGRADRGDGLDGDGSIQERNGECGEVSDAAEAAVGVLRLVGRVGAVRMEDLRGTEEQDQRDAQQRDQGMAAPSPSGTLQGRGDLRFEGAGWVAERHRRWTWAGGKVSHLRLSHIGSQ